MRSINSNKKSPGIPPGLFLLSCFLQRYPRFCFLWMHQFQFINEIFGAGELVHDKEHVTYIYHYIPANGGIVVDVAHGAFPGTVEVEADEVAVRIQRGTAGIAA